MTMSEFPPLIPLRRRRRNAKMAKRVEDLFHDGVQFSLAKLGYPNLELKKEQYDVLERYASTKICAEYVSNGLCCQVLPGIFD